MTVYIIWAVETNMMMWDQGRFGTVSHHQASIKGIIRQRDPHRAIIAIFYRRTKISGKSLLKYGKLFFIYDLALVWDVIGTKNLLPADSLVVILHQYSSQKIFANGRNFWLIWNV